MERWRCNMALLYNIFLFCIVFILFRYSPSVLHWKGMDTNNNKPNNSGNNNNNKYLVIAGIAIIVIIALAIIIPHLKKTSSVDVGGSSTVPGAAVQTPATTKPSVSSGSAGDAAWKATLGEYKGRSIVFGSDCTALPNDQVQALGTKVLLVNNSDIQHTIIFGNGTGITIGAKHYKTALVSGNGTIVVSCDANQKAATVTVK
jgi:heme/copper-type cytochrome/quinol oxidase subunit 2